MSILACAVVVAGCVLFYPWINYDLSASVVGVVETADIGEVFSGNYFDVSTRSWRRFVKERGYPVQVRLSTNKDLISFAHRKSTGIFVQWYFCDMPDQEVRLGAGLIFVDGAEVPALPPHPSPVVADEQGRFAYDAIMHMRDARPGRTRAEAFDLAGEPRDVCVRVYLPTMPRAYRTNVARIPKEQIAAVLGTEVPAASTQKRSK